MNFANLEPATVWQAFFHWNLSFARGLIVLLLISGALYVLSQIGALVLLSFSRKKAQRIASDRKLALAGQVFPPVSIITSLKGPTPGAADSVRSLLLQDYPGDIEIVFATLDAHEPLIAEIQEVIKQTSSRHTVRWIHPVDTEGLNPRTAKIHRAYEASTHPWVFMVCVDTRFSTGYLKKAIELTELRPERYVTSFPVIDSPQTFSAKLEALGLNVDVSQFFLISTLSPDAACAYGGAFLFSKELASRCGAYLPLLKLLTDDITLAKALRLQGGKCYLTDELAYVRQEKHSFRQFWSRQIRWRMIAKYFLKDLFWVAPLSWNQLFLFIGFAVTGNSWLLVALMLIMLSRVGVGYGVQVILEAPAKDRKHAWVLPIYDWLAIAAWLTAVFKHSISWGPTLMILDRHGAVERSVRLEK